MLKRVIKVILKYPTKLLNYIYLFFYYKTNSIRDDYKIDEMIKKEEKILVFSPHVDDETIGLGGTLLKHREKGSEMVLVYLTDGSGTEESLSKEQMIKKRKTEGKQIKTVYGFEKIYFLDEIDGNLNSTDPALIKRIVDLLIKEKPALIYTPFLLDGHIDHVETTKIVASALQIWNQDFSDIYMYEVNWPINPKLINSISIMDKELYEEKSKIYDIFISQWFMEFAIFQLLDRTKRHLTSSGYGVEAFVKVNLKDLSNMKSILKKEDFQPEKFKQISSEYSLILAFRINIRLKNRYSNCINKIMDSK